MLLIMLTHLELKVNCRYQICSEERVIREQVPLGSVYSREINHDIRTVVWLFVLNILHLVCSALQLEGGGCKLDFRHLILALPYGGCKLRY